MVPFPWNVNSSKSATMERFASIALEGDSQLDNFYARLEEAVGGRAVAIRARTRLLPAGGAHEKIFPPTYQGGQYALEKRLVDGQPVDVVLLDSVASQANRMELAL